MSPSLSPSISPSISVSPSISISPSASPSPSPGWENYTRGDYAVLPIDDTNLEVNYSTQDYLDVNADDTTWVDQVATEENMIHQFKDYVGNKKSCILKWKGKTTLQPSLSTVYLQIYNKVTHQWDTVDSDNTSNANTDFILTIIILDLTDYKDASNVISCRVYQLAI